MGNEISKKQFILISVVVILITLVVIISIVNSREDNINVSDNNINASENILEDVEKDDILNQESDNIHEDISNNEELDDEIIITEDEGESNIDIGATSDKLIGLQKRIEVTTNDNNENILPEMESIKDEDIKNILGLDVELLEDYIIRIATGKFDVDMYIIVKPTDEGKDIVKTQINSFLKSYKNAWSKLSVDKYQLLDNIKSVERRGYLVYIVSTDNETLMNVVREFIK